jgi:hypothetical protein
VSSVSLGGSREALEVRLWLASAIEVDVLGAFAIAMEGEQYPASPRSMARDRW